MPSKKSFEITLTVGNLPSNKLALTNRVYVSMELLAKLEQFYGKSSGAGYPILLQNDQPYTVDGHAQVPDGTIALNGLQRRFCKLSLASPVIMSPHQKAVAASGLQLLVHTLTNKPKAGAPSSNSKNSKPTPFDTDRLAPTVLQTLENQVFSTNQVLALDFEGTKLELTIGTVTGVNPKTKEPVDLPMGQLTHSTVLQFAKAPGATHIALEGSFAAAGAGAPSMFVADFDFEKLGIGGLDAEFNQIFRRAFSSRIWPASVIQQMGIHHVRGMLLYGPPGCGKTLIARQIGKALNSRDPKIVNGPEILNKFVGGSEEKIRELFADAEQEQAEAGDASMLHIVIMDEMDAICKQRGSVKDGTGVSDSVVNQLLSKIDGVDSLNNILLIGMTNRKDMIDDALLRPGRLEVHVEIGLPDAAGRLQILNIHTRNMRKAKRVTSEVVEKLPDIAEKTKNFSGAELEGLVKAASSYALTRCVDVKDLSKPPDTSKLRLEYRDFEQAMGDVEPKFGAKATELKTYYRNGIINYGSSFEGLKTTLTRLVHQVASSDKTPLMSVLLRGSAGAGKTALAAQVAVQSGFPFVRMISADEMIGYSESSKCQLIHRVFMDSYKSPLSLILIDDLERIIDYVPTGPRFSNTVLQTLLVLLKKVPPDHNRRLLVIATTSVPHYLEDLGLVQSFGVQQSVPVLDDPKQVVRVLRALGVPDSEAVPIAKSIGKEIGIKQLLMVTEMAKQDLDDGGQLSVPIFLNCLTTVGL